MKKKIILTFMLCLAEVLITPSILAAADTVKITSINDAAVETAPLVESDTPSENIENNSNSFTASQETVFETDPEPENSIEIAGRTLEIYDVDSTAIDAGTHVNRFRNSFLYGHNSASVFGSLASLSLGDTFTVTTDGESTDYKIAEIVTYKKVTSDSDECLDTGICQDGVEYLYNDGTIYKMNSIVKGRGKYQLTIMTCAGTSLGNGDATHRLVLYANRI